MFALYTTIAFTTCCVFISCAIFLLKISKYINSKKPLVIMLMLNIILLVRRIFVFYDWACFDYKIYSNNLNDIIIEGSALIVSLLFLYSIFELYVSFRDESEHLKEEENRRILAEHDRSVVYNQLLETNQDLLYQNQELDEFVQIASHDLKDPVRKIMANCSMVQKDINKGDADKTKKDLQNIKDICKRLINLIDDLLVFSHAGRSDLKVDKDVIIFNCVEEAIDNLPNSRILDAEIKIGKMPIIDCDRSKIVQVFQNLISNALKFKREGVKVQVNITCNNLIFSVSDNGIGIKEEKINSLFVAFRRLNPKHVFEGNGVGLSFCKKVIERHNGMIWVESKFGEGTTFKFTIGETSNANRN